MFFLTVLRVRWIPGQDLAWRPEVGQPKLSPVAKGLVERGMIRLDASQHLLRLFTELGFLALPTTMAAEDRESCHPSACLSVETLERLEAQQQSELARPLRLVLA